MAGEWISQWIPTVIIIALALVAFSIVAYRLLGISSTASIFDAEHNTIARELFINQSGYWIVTIQYAGGVYPVYGIVLKNGSLVKVKWPVPVYTAYNPVMYRFVEYNVYSPGSNPPVAVLLKVGTSIVGIKIMPEYKISLPGGVSSSIGTGPIPVTIIVANDSIGASWTVTVAVNGPGGYSYTRSGNTSLAWVQYINASQYIDSSISLNGEAIGSGWYSVSVSGVRYYCTVTPTNYTNVRNGTIIYTLNCIKPTITWLVFLSGNIQAGMSVNGHAYTLSQGWNYGYDPTPFNVTLTLTWQSCIWDGSYIDCPVSLNGTILYARFSPNWGGSPTFSGFIPGTSNIQYLLTATGTYTATLSWTNLRHFLYVIIGPGYNQSPYIAYLNIVNNTYGAPWNITTTVWDSTITLLSGSGNVYNAIIHIPGIPVNVSITPIVYVRQYNLTCFFNPTSQVVAYNGSTITFTANCYKGAYWKLIVFLYDPNNYTLIYYLDYFYGFSGGVLASGILGNRTGIYSFIYPMPPGNGGVEYILWPSWGNYRGILIQINGTGATYQWVVKPGGVYYLYVIAKYNPPSTTTTSSGGITVKVNAPSGVSWTVSWTEYNAYGQPIIGGSGSYSGSGSDTFTISDYWNKADISISGYPSYCTASPTSYNNVNPPATVTFTITCSGLATTSTTTTTTGTTTSLPSTWNLYISVNDKYGAGYEISDNYGNYLQAASTLNNVLFNTYSSSQSQVTLTAVIQYPGSGYSSCTISPSSTIVYEPSSGNAYASFTVSCSSGSATTTTPAPAPTTTPTPTPTTTSTPPTTTTITITTPTTTTTSNTVVTTTCGNFIAPSGGSLNGVTTATWIYQLCSGWQWSGWSGGGASIFGNKIEVAWTAHAYSTTTTLACVSSIYGQLRCVLITTTYTIVDSNTATWYPSGVCPNNHWYISAGGAGTNYNTAWETVTIICQQSNMNAIFIFPWDWNPPALPIWLLLRGGTNTLAPLEPIYIQAFNAYANWFWANTGWFIDLLILIALITPILARPVIGRRIRV